MDDEETEREEIERSKSAFYNRRRGRIRFNYLVSFQSTNPPDKEDNFVEFRKK